jgi:hypothetical protein
MINQLIKVIVREVNESNKIIFNLGPSLRNGRAGTTSWFGALKSLPHKYTRLQLVCYFSLAILI